MNRSRYFIFIFSGLIFAALIPLPAFSAQPDSAIKLKAVRIEKAPHLDGLLADEVWKLAEPFLDFKMVEPAPGSEPTEKQSSEFFMMKPIFMLASIVMIVTPKKFRLTLFLMTRLDKCKECMEATNQPAPPTMLSGS